MKIKCRRDEISAARDSSLTILIRGKNNGDGDLSAISRFSRSIDRAIDREKPTVFDGKSKLVSTSQFQKEERSAAERFVRSGKVSGQYRYIFDTDIRSMLCAIKHKDARWQIARSDGTR